MIILNYFPDSTGHISLALTGLGKEPDQYGRYNIYLSYLPANERSKTGCRFHCVADDLLHTAAISIILPSIESNNRGLSEAAIFDWLQKEFKPTHEPFTWLGNNCAAVVYRALVVGQQRSPALEQEIVRLTTWFFSMHTPGRVISYSDALGKKLLSNSLTAIRYAEIQRLCSDEMKLSPFLRLDALHDLIKKFDGDFYFLNIHAIFCQALKFILKDIFQELSQELVFVVKTNQIKFYEDLLLLIYFDATLNSSADAYFAKIKSVVNFFVEHIHEQIDQHENNALTADGFTLATKHIERAETIFENAIKQGIEIILKPFLANEKVHFLNSRERIRQVLNFMAENINDDLHPHKEYQQSSDNLRQIMPGSGLGIARQF